MPDAHGTLRAVATEAERPSRRFPSLDLSVALLVGLLAFAYRYLTHTNFNNDHFAHLSRSQAWLAGDWPIRDYTDPGSLLLIGFSAGAQLLLGRHLLSELLLTIGGLAVAAGATSWVTTRLTGSRALGVLAAVLQVAAEPQLFGYPKFLIYPILLILCLRYVQRPTVSRMVPVAMWVALAGLIRHDHGVYTSIGALIAVVSAHRPQGIASTVRGVARFVATVATCLLPFLIYVQVEMGILNYLRLGIEMSSNEAQRSRATDGSLPSFSLDRGRLVTRRPTQPEDLPRIRVRWSPAVSEQERAVFEQRARLLSAEPTDTRTWAYRADPDGFEALGEVLNSPAVEDVAGIDRQSMRLTEWEPAMRLALRSVGLDHLEPGPPIVSALAASTLSVVLFYLCWSMPAVAFLLWWLKPRRAPAGSSPVDVDAVIPTLCGVTLACTAGFLRLDILRLADVFGTFPILACWVLATLIAVDRQGLRAVARIAACALAIVVILCVYRLGGSEFERAGQFALHPTASFERAVQTTRSARDWPWALQWPGDSEWRLARYIHDCTNPDDRMLVTWAAPEFYFFSKRPFAGREGPLFPVLRRPASFEPQILDAWKQKRVPIVLTNEESYKEFATTFPALAAHLATAYAAAGTTQWDERPAITVHVDRSRVATGRDPEFGLPCFSGRQPAAQARP